METILAVIPKYVCNFLFFLSFFPSSFPSPPCLTIPSFLHILFFLSPSPSLLAVLPHLNSFASPSLHFSLSLFHPSSNFICPPFSLVSLSSFSPLISFLSLSSPSCLYASILPPFSVPSPLSHLLQAMICFVSSLTPFINTAIT